MDSLNWYNQKKKIDQLPAQFAPIIAQYERNEPDKVKTGQSGKLMRIEVNLNDITQLIVYQSQQDGVKHAWYVTFDTERGICYKRDLVL